MDEISDPSAANLVDAQGAEKPQRRRIRVGDSSGGLDQNRRRRELEWELNASRRGLPAGRRDLMEEPE